MRWLLLMACTCGGGPPAELFSGHWTVRGEQVGQASVGREDGAVVVTSRYEMTLDGERFDWQVVEKVANHSKGGLAHWTLTRGDQQRVEVWFEPPVALWTFEDADGVRKGEFPVDERPLWPFWPDRELAPDTAVTLWDGASLQVRDAMGTATGDRWELQAGELGWSGAIGDGGTIGELAVPGGGRLSAGSMRGEAPDAVGMTRLRVEGLPGTDPRTWVAMDASWPDGETVTVRRPHPLELPVDAVAPEADPSTRGIELAPVPVDLGIDLPEGTPRRQVVQAVMDALAARVTYKSTPQRPTVKGTLARGEGDCDDLSAVMVGALAFEGITARVAHGMLLTKEGLVPHAWVEVWYGSAGWVPADPSFRQVVADAGRVRLEDPRLAATLFGPLRVEQAR